MRWAAGLLLVTLSLAVGWGQRAGEVASLALEVERLEHALDSVRSAPVRSRGGAPGRPRDFTPSEPPTPAPGLTVPSSGPETPTLGRCSDSEPSRTTGREGPASSESVASTDEASATEPVFLTVEWPGRPRLNSWIECGGSILVLVDFGAGVELWLSEGEAHRHWTVTHVDRRMVIFDDERSRRSLELLLGASR